jgi:ribonuclease-3
MAHPKGVLLERAQKLGLERPEFRTARTGPEHEPVFITDVVLNGEVIGTGQGGTKRTAEKHAAEEALAALESRQERAAKGGKAKDKAPAKPEGKSAPKGPEGKPGAKGAPAAKGQEPKPAAKAEPKAAAASKAPAVTQTKPAPAAPAQTADVPAVAEEEEPFDGPWPMFDDLLAAVVTVAERRVFADLRGEDARVAIRDFSLALYKELLLGLGEIEEVDEEE